ncbi:hypothetical protein PV08_11136 [Exophiala spinifera]|uniref:Uncharacterized protein n=1 Tax=Exophiala spinifera TaxID=91928 RepID=A0A0D2AUJ4_9EURO|nr:uncharacterized protein PV08_11136 [Exophiala spinifera]KIW10175.1 hypothetical protein PV08_11136 [Exophiala spinifera]
MAQDGKIFSKTANAVVHALSLKRSANYSETQAAPSMESRQELDESSLKKVDLDGGSRPSLLQRHWRWFLFLGVVCVIVIVVAAVIGAKGVSSDMSLGATPFEAQTTSYKTISTSPIRDVVETPPPTRFRAM